ncbi:SGNH/GDSL hydrolase family protein [Massilia forsythiae]|uniref:SGNH/GDSL hydrolase family protein n=1 Tax=Massilia forsythiae TaxID=2728020 RepID=A0A7Z2W0H5_9BURK|nr:SGNH/GDSL hydrolase family protein [Massilia forsythiae]QJE02614.1 SGNH/GDSL hydrolase family protein [Massilia forsythiae]
MTTFPSGPGVQPARPRRRAFLRGAAGLAAGLAHGPAPAQTALAALADSPCATWGTALTGPAPASSMLSFNNQTLRLIVRASIGGARVRVRLSNEWGNAALQVGAAWLGIHAAGANVAAASNRQLRFNGKAGATMAAGATLSSDALDFPLPPFAGLALSLYLPGAVQAASVHDAAFQTSYVSATGDHAGAAAMAVQRTLYSWPLLAEIDAAGPAPGSATAAPASALVALGDSLTDGARSSGNADRRWPDYLARRLAAQRPAGWAPVGVVNRGISGNRLLADSADTPLAGRAAVERFERDVAATAGARYLAVLVGINDIIRSPSANPVTADQLAAGYTRLAARAHARGMLALGATMPPFEGYTWYTTARDGVRRRANDWIRNGGAFDAVADFDAVLRDPRQPTRLLARYDSGDHLHPQDAGYEAMAQAVPLGLFAP